MMGNGDCFMVAGRYILDHPNTTLIHGIVEGQGELNGVLFTHAWIEKGNKVIDKSNGNDISIDKGAYYAIGNIQKKYIKKYNKVETCKNMLKSKH